MRITLNSLLKTKYKSMVAVHAGKRNAHFGVSVDEFVAFIEDNKLVDVFDHTFFTRGFYRLDPNADWSIDNLGFNRENVLKYRNRERKVRPVDPNAPRILTPAQWAFELRAAQNASTHK